MEMKYILNEMSKSDRDALKKKYNNCILQTISSFESFKCGYKSTNANTQYLKIKFFWNDLDHVFNACCDFIDNDEYSITLNLYTVAELERQFKELQINVNYSYQIISAILTFIIWHELMHIVFGHCTIPNADFKNLSNDIKRSYEMKCDMVASTNMLVDIEIFREKATHDSMLSMYASLMCSLYIYFNILEKEELIRMQNNLKLHQLYPNDKSDFKSVTSKERTHPFITFRFNSICNSIESELYRRDYSTRDIDEIYELSLEFIESFNYTRYFEINPFYRRNKKSQENDMNFNYSEMKRFLKKQYIDY